MNKHEKLTSKWCIEHSTKYKFTGPLVEYKTWVFKLNEVNVGKSQGTVYTF